MKNKRAVIFANGDSISNESIFDEIVDAELLIAADGGIHHFQELGIVPDVLIGDLDSIKPAYFEKLEKGEIITIQHPPRKDETDLELALQYIRQRGIKNVAIYFALGARWDMTIANLLLASSEPFQNLNIRFLDGPHEITILGSGGILNLSGHKGDTLSLIPVGGNAEGIDSQGLEYPLSDDTLVMGSSRGVSNVLTQEQVTVHLRSGFLLCIHIKHSMKDK